MAKKINKNVIITGMLCISAIEIVALYLGYDGYLLALIVGVLAAAIGVTIPTPKFIK